MKGLSYGVNANLLSQSSGSTIIWNGLDQAYIPLDESITRTTGDTYNIDPFITYIKGNNRHSLRTRYLSVTNNNLTDGIDVGKIILQTIIIPTINGRRILKSIN